MSTLLLRLAAPIQSWGIMSKFDTRDTAREPTKSGIVGLLAAALGRSRTDSFEDLNSLGFGVRIDQPGSFLRDYHTAKQEDEGNSFVTTRYYLSDAIFLVGLEGDAEFLQSLICALQNPVFPLYLGRRSCPPASQVVLGIRDMPLRQAIENEPWQASEWYIRKTGGNSRLTVVYDALPKEEGTFLRRDLVVSLNQEHRKYGFRSVVDIAEALPVFAWTHEQPTDHDALKWGD